MRFARFFVISCSLYLSPFVQAKPSSVIPERREFPVSKTINACHDFYEYSCSEVKKSFVLRPDRSYHDFAFNDSAERLLDAKKKYLADLQKADKLSSRGQDLKTIFSACMNINAAKKEERAEVGRLLQERAALKSHADLQRYFSEKILNTDFSFLGAGTEANFDDPNWDDVIIAVSGMYLPERSYYYNKEVYRDYENLLTAFFQELRLDKAKERAKRVAAFEKGLADVMPLPAELRQLYVTPSKWERSDIEKNFAALGLSPVLAKIPERTLIRNLFTDAYKYLNTAFTSGDIDTLKDYYLYHAATYYMDDAYPAFFNKSFAFEAKHLGGPKKRSERNERCTKMIMGSYGKEIDVELIDVLFKDFPDEKVSRIVDKVRASIIAGLKENSWLSKAARKSAIAKTKDAGLQLTRPKNDAEWDFNPKLSYSPEHPYRNKKALNEALRDKMFRELNEKRDRNRWGRGPLVVNAWYNPSDNKFTLPIGILQYPFFDTDAPDEVNLGAAGAVIGHELGHGIDDQGSRFDSEGRLNQWMNDKDLLKFGELGSKLVAQFDKIGHNGKLTLGENIGDLVGLSFAYNAAFPENAGDLETKKKFFLSYARVWCAVMRPGFDQVWLKTDPHALGYARVNQQVVHQNGFYEAYGCKAGDKMYLPPGERVRIW